MNLFTHLGAGADPARPQWLVEPPQWQVDDQGRLHLTPAPETDFFRPIDRPGYDNAALLCASVSGDFTARTRVRAVLVGFGDAAALTVRASAEQWAKICVERSPAGEVAIVSVVTDPWSDDANNELLSEPAAHLRLTRKGNLFGMHYSLDGRAWRFVRAFAMRAPARLLVGVHAQAPFVGGCRATFDFLEMEPRPVADFRSGE
ncbi:MAG: DUF1349 domain-containing protein [Gemmatimonadota bacterium]